MTVTNQHFIIFIINTQEACIPHKTTQTNSLSNNNLTHPATNCLRVWGSKERGRTQENPTQTLGQT